jgi:post-segregation antitoxin (ccd killing protein)
MGKKVRTNLYIDSEILKEAQELGLNISKTCENALKVAIERLRPMYTKNNPNEAPKDNNWWGRPDLNRGPERPRLRA